MARAVLQKGEKTHDAYPYTSHEALAQEVENATRVHDASLPSAFNTRKLLLPPVSVGEIRAHTLLISEDTLILCQFLSELLQAMAYGLILTSLDGVARSAAVKKAL